VERDKQASDEPPEGFSYRPEFLSVREEANLLIQFADLDFRPFDFHGYVAKRRIVEYMDSNTISVPAGQVLPSQFRLS
jgi:hypothetical protein